MEGLEVECSSCDGTGKKADPNYLERRYYPDCPDCTGKGVKLTDEGEDLIEFMKRWLVPRAGRVDWS